MIHGIGTDITAIDRFRVFLDKGNRGLLERLFTRRELQLCEARKDAASCLAARFAAKEACLKAFGTGLRHGLSWHDIEVSNGEEGKPQLNLTGKALELFVAERLLHIHISLSHDAGSAVAMVVLEK